MLVLVAVDSAAHTYIHTHSHTLCALIPFLLQGLPHFFRLVIQSPSLDVADLEWAIEELHTIGVACCAGTAPKL